MFGVTYLGHQGWLVESEGSRLLVDPLLDTRLTALPDDPIEIYPPRRIDLPEFPPVHGVFFTHEHPDHLNLPSVLRLDREVPVFLPARSSTAAQDLLAELGFHAQALRSGDEVTLGHLQIHAFHAKDIVRDEWDVMPLVIHDRAGHGSLATSIDAPESDDFARFASEKAGRIGLWASSHNYMDLFPVHEDARQPPEENVTQSLARDIVQRFESQFRGRAKPEALAILSTGFSFAGDLAWLNRHVFPGSAERVAPVVARSLATTAVRAPIPGWHLSFANGRAVAEVPSRSFLAARDRGEWPPHSGEAHEGVVADYTPASGRRSVSEAEQEVLGEELRRFATAHFAHLGGMLGGFLMIQYRRGRFPFGKR